MAHLSIEEMIDFVSISELNEDTLYLASRVNSHILCCPDCLKKVEAFQNVYDALMQNHVNKSQSEFNNAAELIEALKDSIDTSNIELEIKPEMAK